MAKDATGSGSENPTARAAASKSASSGALYAGPDRVLHHRYAYRVLGRVLFTYVQRSTLCIVAQGAKIVMIGRDTYGYEAGQMAVYSIDVPMAGRVTRGSVSEPYLLLMLDLDAEKIAELAPKVFPHGVPQPRDLRSLYVGEADTNIVDAATRLLELMAQPADAELLAPLVRDEILIRLLRSPLGWRSW